MKIDTSSVNLAAKSEYTEVNVNASSLQVWGSRNGNNTNVRVEQDNETERDTPAAVLELTEKGAKLLEDAQQKAFSSMRMNRTPNIGTALAGLDEGAQIKIDMLLKLIERLTGKKLRIRVPSMEWSGSADPAAANGLGTGGQQGWGLSYQSVFYHSEQESMEFSAVGNVTTADGRSIQFDMTVGMSREFIQQSSMRIEMGDARLVDPLVINYASNSATLTDEKFRFDIDNDGTEDQVSRLGAGSGFLALDLDQDGKINNGGELFGTQSGNGFEDLAAYDGDGNGWIDENDAIFHKLRIWSVDSQGNSSLYSLGEKGVGAIYLGNVSSQYTLKGAGVDNPTNGVIQRSGVFLHESGAAGSIQHVDFAI